MDEQQLVVQQNRSWLVGDGDTVWSTTGTDYLMDQTNGYEKLILKF